MFACPEPELAFSPAGEIRAAQDRLLAEHVRYLAANSPWYTEKFRSLGLDPAGIRGLDDLARLPLTAKADLETDGDAFLCVPRERVVDICLTSGTTARPVAFLQTAMDLERVGCNEEISFRAAGITPGDTVLIAAAIDRCFMAGLAYFLGLTRLGATAIRAGSSSVPVVAELIRNHRPTAIVGVPTLLLAIAGRLTAEGTDPAGLGLERLICIGEPVRAQDFSLSPLGESLAGHWGAKIFGTYASTEMATAFCDCEAGRGGHVHPELVAVEVLDEEGRSVPPGSPGEVVATPLQVTGMPLLRFRTGDIAALHTDPCPCGRTTPRLGPILGRKAHLLKYKGTTVYPPAIFAVLQSMPGVRGSYIEVRGSFDLSDQIRVVVGTDDPDLTPKIVAERIAASVRVKPEVLVRPVDEVAARIMQSGKRKPTTFFDLRGKS